MIQYNGLIAPKSYADASQEFRGIICNGCGTKGWKGVLVPETAWGLSLTRACNIHDWMYEYGKTEADKIEADDIFLRNMRRLIWDGTPWYLIPLIITRNIRAVFYYEVVKNWGDDAFWAGKIR